MNQKAEPKAQRAIKIIFRLCHLIKELPTLAWLHAAIATDPSTALLNRTDCSGYPMSCIGYMSGGRKLVSVFRGLQIGRTLRADT